MDSIEPDRDSVKQMPSFSTECKDTTPDKGGMLSMPSFPWNDVTTPFSLPSSQSARKSAGNSTAPSNILPHINSMHAVMPVRTNT
mmetsp:Transcript_11546/g.21396  ORF Transcript_11546/g.21396 Transcript_11546/m.21396 type:complete len:85 (+) Transcript_11546:170-424(+)